VFSVSGSRAAGLATTTGVAGGAAGTPSGWWSSTGASNSIRGWAVDEDELELEEDAGGDAEVEVEVTAKVSIDDDGAEVNTGAVCDGVVGVVTLDRADDDDIDEDAEVDDEGDGEVEATSSWTAAVAPARDEDDEDDETEREVEDDAVANDWEVCATGSTAAGSGSRWDPNSSEHSVKLSAIVPGKFPKSAAGMMRKAAQQLKKTQILVPRCHAFLTCSKRARAWPTLAATNLAAWAAGKKTRSRTVNTC